jgi:membrane protease YdiL (CAAX protease family)
MIINEKKYVLLQSILVWIIPLIVLFIQIISPIIVFFLGIIFIIGIICLPYFRKILLIICFMIFGYLFWLFANSCIMDKVDLLSIQLKIITRSGLLGYIILFTSWHLLQKPKNNFLRCGDKNAIIHFPFIWKGFKEIEWRFTLIFCLICVGAIFGFVLRKNLDYHIILYGIIFSIINSLLEEHIWRGFILTRLIDISSEKIALVISSLGFGLYHYSLNFPLWICLIFAIGGFYMGGSAIKSKGLLSPIIMHIMVNIVFVFIGII